MIAMMVVQFGFAMIPRFRYWPIASALISGTTSGMSGSIRKADELSTTTAPEFQAAGAHSPHRAGRSRYRDAKPFRSHVCNSLSRVVPDGLPHPFAHFGGSHPPDPGPLAEDVPRPVPVRAHLFYRVLDQGGLPGHMK